jgi:hypothetical protein
VGRAELELQAVARAVHLAAVALRAQVAARALQELLRLRVGARLLLPVMALPLRRRKRPAVAGPALERAGAGSPESVVELRASAQLAVALRALVAAGSAASVAAAVEPL